MPLEQAAPVAVAELGGALGRSDEIGEEDRCEHGVRNPPRPGFPARNVSIASTANSFSWIAPPMPGTTYVARLRGSRRATCSASRASSSLARTSVGTRIAGRTSDDVEIDLHAPEIDPRGRARSQPVMPDEPVEVSGIVRPLRVELRGELLEELAAAPRIALRRNRSASSSSRSCDRARSCDQGS